VYDPSQQAWADALKPALGKSGEAILSTAFRYVPTTGGTSLSLSMPLTPTQRQQVEAEAFLIAKTQEAVRGIVKQMVDAKVQSAITPASRVSSSFPLANGGSKAGATIVAKKDGTIEDFDITKVNAAIDAEGKAQNWTPSDIQAIKEQTAEAFQGISGQVSVTLILQTWLGIAKSLDCVVNTPEPVSGQISIAQGDIGKQFENTSTGGLIGSLTGNQYHSLLRLIENLAPLTTTTAATPSPMVLACNKV
jgi:hypothetical protein